MAKLPITLTTPTTEAMVKLWETKNEPPRPYLGASVLGNPCERALFYQFRWCSAETFDGRMLRLFNRGQREEDIFVQELRGIGVNIRALDDRTGKQFQAKAVGGHSGGSMDGCAIGFIESPNAWHVVEFKTHSAKSFAKLQNEHVFKSKPLHYAQMQLYMRWFEMERAYYFGVNKDTDEIYGERIHYDKPFADALEKKAERVITAPTPPPKISENPAWYECKFCPSYGVCHGNKVPPVSCRTCVHSTPELDGNARWSCALHKMDIPEHGQRIGCDEHRYIPALIPYAKAVNADPIANTIEYELPNGTRFTNGPHGPTSYDSKELSGIREPSVFSDPFAKQLREQFDARVVSSEPAEKAA